MKKILSVLYILTNISFVVAMEDSPRGLGGKLLEYQQKIEREIDGKKVKKIKSKIKLLKKEILQRSKHLSPEISIEVRKSVSSPQLIFDTLELDGKGHSVILLESDSTYFSHNPHLIDSIEFDDNILHDKGTEKKIKELKRKLGKKKIEFFVEIAYDSKIYDKLEDKFDKYQDVEKFIKFYKENDYKKYKYNKSKYENYYNNKEEILRLQRKINHLDCNYKDSLSHVSHVSGVLASTNLKVGIACGAKVHPTPIKYLLKHKNVDIDDLIENINKHDAKTRVISCSQTMYFKQKDVKAFLAFLEKNDFVLVYAAGNEQKAMTSHDMDDYSSQKFFDIGNIKSKRIVNVGSFNLEKWRISTFSNLPGTQTQFIYAPGSDIISYVLDEKEDEIIKDKMSGTSMATPHVAGIFTVLDKYFRNIPMDKIIDVVCETSTNFLANRDPSIEGYGLINAMDAYLKLEEIEKLLNLSSKRNELVSQFFPNDDGLIISKYIEILDSMNIGRCAPFLYNDQKINMTQKLQKVFSNIEFSEELFLKAQKFREEYDIVKYN